MFSFFKKKPTSFRKEDLIWTTKAARYRGAYQLAQDSQKDYRLLVAFFPATLEEFAFVLDGAQLTYQSIQNTNDITGANIYVCNDSFLRKHDTWLQTNAHHIEVIFLEHYPTAKREAPLNTRLNELQIHHCYTFSMDASMMQLFSSERLTNMIKLMGIDADESLSHSSITKSIARAQKKLQHKINAEIPCHSPEEWMEQHHPIS